MFHNTNLISNAERGHQIVNSKENFEIQASICSLRNKDSAKILGIHINNNLNFDDHANQICKKESKKVRALARIAGYMINKQRTLIKAFVDGL